MKRTRLLLLGVLFSMPVVAPSLPFKVDQDVQYKVTASSVDAVHVKPEGCPKGFHACNSDWCCPDGSNYFCAYNECSKVSNKCFKANTDEELYDLRRCCTGGLLGCP